MGEIKFRAFWKEAGIIVEVDTLRPSGGIEFFVEVSSGNSKWKELQVLDEPTQYILLQYTGLKDKNGREIYKGDMFKDNDSDRIIWCNQCLGWQVGWERDGKVLCHNCEGDYSLSECVKDGVMSDVLGEVIGNVYENPALIDTTNKN